MWLDRAISWTRCILTSIFGVGFCYLLFSVQAARADLIFDSNTPHKEIWQQVYDSLPSALKTQKAVVVEVVSAKTMQQLFEKTMGQPCSDVVDGCYYSGGDRIDADATILLLDTLQGDRARMVFAHEYGHFVWDQLLTSAERDAYKAVWQRQLRKHCLVSTYASTSVEEGFAEAFSAYVCARQKLDTCDVLSEKFLNKLVSRRTDPSQVATSS
ncbi:Peptidase MA superfamily [Chthonomonas calidirosea]|uniref:Peptidase MA superfamily n=1 Tax=Chthonomonas calidirosea (strain DSM 23976 / ICMP 18418 / T49) TaxID=1303518 RepID=S0EX43_CHTCT|nr:peptidase MA [Chthonomonas calidirosea]CCW36001.1 Peptidase MA superfamily [Chthonomonas calidirosea T49]CEK18622.1 Peptidase MA superfamily [Chthonomonas calidirosea]